MTPRVTLRPRVRKHRDGTTSHGAQIGFVDLAGQWSVLSEIIMRPTPEAAARDATELAARRGWVVVESVGETGPV